MCTDMSTLLELQVRLRRAILSGDAAEIVDAIMGDGLDPAARLGIYRHHAFATLGEALQGTFPLSAGSSTSAFLPTPRTSTCASIRRIRGVSSNTAPTSPTFSPASPRARDYRTWPMSPGSNGPSISPPQCGRRRHCRRRRSPLFQRKIPHT
jgi:hypothetical protein